MNEYKIIFAGSMGAGKTTAVKALSDDQIISTDVANTDRDSHSKELTTVGIDYGQIMLDSGVKVALYGTPGQKRFEMVVQMVVRGALGCVLLIDSSSEKAQEDFVYYLSFLRDKQVTNIVVGLTHADAEHQHLTTDTCYTLMEKDNVVLPIFTVDPREKTDILLMVEALLASIEASVNS